MTLNDHYEHCFKLRASFGAHPGLENRFVEKHFLGF